ncbi:MAG: CDP-alcohol phosphatidyltransferase family protein [Anaerolineae bacterium]
MISKWARGWTEKIVTALVRPLHRVGVPPDLLTIMGLVTTLGAAGLLAFGYQRLGGVVIIPASILDALDGALARLGGKTTPYGAFLDSTLDRWGEIALYLGLLYYYSQRAARMETILIYLTIAGSLMVSYTRARAEGLGIECRVGLFTRLERLITLIAGLLLQLMPWALGILALFTNLTAVQRLWHVRQATRK